MWNSHRANFDAPDAHYDRLCLFSDAQAEKVGIPKYCEDCICRDGSVVELLSRDGEVVNSNFVRTGYVKPKMLKQVVIATSLELGI
jgi:hypothetical protein